MANEELTKEINNMSLCDALEARFQSADERLMEAVMSTVGGSDGE